MMNAPVGLTKPEAGVTATRPAEMISAPRSKTPFNYGVGFSLSQARSSSTFTLCSS